MAANPETRRQRLRRELTTEVIATARQQLQAGGPSGISWRGIARSVGINPASLYTYFDNLDEVFTAVILDSFQRLGATVQTAASELTAESPDERLVGLALAFRRWALDHPAEFNLIFTDQLPGYAAPPDGPTVEAQGAIFGPFAAAVAASLGTEPPDQTSAGEPTVPELPDDAALFIRLWATMHGLVMLEINHHLPFLDDHETVFVAAMRGALDGARSAVERSDR